MSKGLNRAFGTLVAGALGLGAHYLADLSGPKGEPIILGLLVFILGKKLCTYPSGIYNRVYGTSDQYFSKLTR